MSMRQPFLTFVFGTVLLLGASGGYGADDFETFLKPLFEKSCVECHGKKKTKGKVDLYKIQSLDALASEPKMVMNMIEAIDAFDMPPEDEPELDEATRLRLIASLKNVLHKAAEKGGASRMGVRRLNRFQYANAVQDLFELKKPLFPLPEKMMRRFGNYHFSPSGKMPESVQVACESTEVEGGFKGVRAYPKDLRASHGFDNQANQLTLSPLLLDSFLKLSVSIVESPDFNSSLVGIWNDFFAEPAGGVDASAEVDKRLSPFLRQAFRREVDDAVLARYREYTLAQINSGLGFTDAMKKVASAAMSSPVFLLQSIPEDQQQYELASKLSFFLWGSGPDGRLLDLAASGTLSQDATLDETVDAMLGNARVERFLDAFPTQWMQLENLMAATPDAKKYAYFTLDGSKPASTHMVLEPLLLFDAVFVENRPVVELISPTFSYQSEFLKKWYADDLAVPPLSDSEVAKQNQMNVDKRADLESKLSEQNAELAAIVDPVRERLLAPKIEKLKQGTQAPIDLKPIAAWEFNGDLKDSLSGKPLKAHGPVEYEGGMVVLGKTYLESLPIGVELKAKTMEVWMLLDNVKQRGGGAMTIESGRKFDSIVLGERRPNQWISGSDHFARTDDFKDAPPQNPSPDLIHLAMVYHEDGTTALYRNGEPYGEPFKKARFTFPADQTKVLFGLRHSPGGGNKHLAMKLDKARLYDRALTPEEIAASASGNFAYVTDKEIVKALAPELRKQKAELTRAIRKTRHDISKVPPALDKGKQRNLAVKQHENNVRGMLNDRRFTRVPAKDPRYGGIITNAAALTMTSGPKHTKPISRGSWLIEVVFNDPPPPPPNDVPPLDEEAGDKNQTIREKFAEHRSNERCASCHTRLDPLGFALENFDSVGRWRDRYDNRREVDASGSILKKYQFDGVVDFKKALVSEDKRFARAFTMHLMRFALARELGPADAIAVDQIIAKTEKGGFRLKSLIKEVILSDSFRGAPADLASTHP